MSRIKQNTRPPQKALPLEFDPLAGTHIDNACREAVDLAVTNKRPVSFKFNDVPLLATPRSSWKTLSKRYNSECALRRGEYRKSPEGIAAAETRRNAIVEKQQIVSSLLKELPRTLAGGDLDKAVKWLQRFTDPSDDIAVKFNHREVANTFIAYGYQENRFVGNPPEWFCTRERIGLYLVGQAINCLNHGLPPHSRTLFFCKKYFAAPKGKSVHNGSKRSEASGVSSENLPAPASSQGSSRTREESLNNPSHNHI